MSEVQVVHIACLGGMAFLSFLALLCISQVICFLVDFSGRPKISSIVHGRESTGSKKLSASSTTAGESDLIYYPKGLESRFYDDDELEDMFLKQISEIHGAGGDFLHERDEVDHEEDSISALGAIIGTKMMEEEPIELVEGVPMEIVYRGRLSFANYVGRNIVSEKKKAKNEKSGKKAVFGSGIRVKLSTGEDISISASQIISVWDILADDDLPDDRESWAEVASDALQLLSIMSPRKSDLQEFWSIVGQRSSVVPVDSLDLGVYIHQEHRFGAWINPYATATASSVRALTAAQRYAAALLLHYDNFHFKRRQSRLCEGKSLEFDYLMEHNENDNLLVIEGGYRCLDEGLVLFREGEVFQQYFKDTIASDPTSNSKNDGDAPFRSGCITRQMRALEMYSMSPRAAPPPPTVKHLLKRLQKDMNPSGAKDILSNMGLGMKSSLQSQTDSRITQNSEKENKSVVTPWSAAVLEETEALQHDMTKMRRSLENIEVSKVGKKGVNGRLDFRVPLTEAPVICIDGSKTVFLDDAFSLSPTTGELLIHIVDVVGSLRKYESLLSVAKERVASVFFPSGPAHMLPPQALEVLKLSAMQPNEAITVALTIEEDSGEIISSRVFPSTIGRVFPIDMKVADELLHNYREHDFESDEIEKKAGYPMEVIRDLLQVQKMVSKLIAKNTWIDASYSKKADSVQFTLNKKSGTYTPNVISKTQSSVMLNAMLTIYSNITCSFCEGKNVNVPIAWENRDRKDTSTVRRFASQPLRNWLALLQQKQIRSALKMDIALSRKDCALAVSHHNKRRKDIAKIQVVNRDIMSYESLEAHCATIIKSGQRKVVLSGVYMGGDQVKLKSFGSITGRLYKQRTVELQKGDVVTVKVNDIRASQKKLDLEYCSNE